MLLEFAILAVPLFMILFGIIEFGSAYSQNLDVRHGAREGARLVAVNYKPTSATGDAQTTVIVTEICKRMGSSGDSTMYVRLQRTGASAGTDSATVTIQKDPLKQVTNFLNFALQNVKLSSKVETRLEQNATWNETQVAGTPSRVPCP